MECRLLTVDDLAERWGCTASKVLDIVRTRKVPYLQIGAKKRLDQRGPNSLRFRPGAIERWEEDEEVTWTTPERVEAEARKAEASLAASGWDGKSRLSRDPGAARRSRRPSP
jgi:hypothetical protein